MTRALLTVFMAGLGALSIAQNTTDVQSVGPLTATVTLMRINTDHWPLDCVIIHATGNYGWGYDLMQESINTPGGLVPLAAPRATGLSGSAGYGPVQAGTEPKVDVFTPFWNFVNAQTDNSKKYGGFFFRVFTKNSSSVITSEFRWHFMYTPAYNSIDAGSVNSGGNNGANANDIKNQNVNQGGFWSSIFVPQEENVNLLKAQINRAATWGPLGIILALRDESNAVVGEGGPQGYVRYVLVTPGPYGNLNFDLRPYSGYIVLMRGVFAGALWFTATFALWKRVVQRA